MSNPANQAMTAFTSAASIIRYANTHNMWPIQLQEVCSNGTKAICGTANMIQARNAAEVTTNYMEGQPVIVVQPMDLEYQVLNSGTAPTAGYLRVVENDGRQAA